MLINSSVATQLGASQEPFMAEKYTEKPQDRQFSSRDLN
jgi:hypothetical protein